VRSWVIPPRKSSDFVAHMERILDIYKLPYDPDFPVVCMDESPKQLIEDCKPSIGIGPGRDLKVDYEYIRKGVINIFMASEPLKGKRLVKVTEFKTKKDWAVFIKEIADHQYPKAKKIILVMDNFKTHSASALYETFEPSEAKRIWDRFEFVFTPVHGSWLNMAEIELQVLNGQCLKKHMATMDQVAKQAKAWNANRNNKNKRIKWQFTTKDARIKLNRLYPSYQS